MPTFTKYLKNLKREDRITTTDPRQAAQLRAEGYVEAQPKKKQDSSSSSASQSDKKTSK